MRMKFTTLVIVFLMLFSLTACNTGFNLMSYKTEAKLEIQIYANNRKSNYCEDNWIIVCNLVDTSKAAIDTAENKTDVDNAVKDAKDAIDEVEQLEWTNSNAVYAFVKAGYENDILKNLERMFTELSFQRIYITEKNINAWTPLTLLFILEETGITTQQEFLEILSQDKRISYAAKSCDLYFETIDTRHIDKAKDTIAVGETLTLEANGSIDYYVQPFGFEGFLIKPVVNKTYTVADFPQVNLKSVEARYNGWLYLELATEGYFEVIKAANALSMLSTIEKVELDKSEVVSSPPPIWQISDTSVVVFESTTASDYPTATIKGIKPGKVTVDFDGVSCEITII